jgi:phage-related protein
MLAGKTGMAGLMAIVGAAPKDYDKLTKAINNSNGAAENMYKTANDNLKGKITELKSKTEALGISFGRIIAPYALKAVKALQKLIDKFDKLPKKQKETIVKIAAIVAVAGPMLMIFGKMVSTVGSAISTFGKFGKAIKGGKSLLGALAMPGGKVVLIIAAVVAAIVAAVLIGKKYKKQIKAFFEKVKEMFGNFKKKVIEVKNSITGFFKAFGKSKTAKSFIKPIQKQLKNLKKNFAELKEALQPLKKAITKFFGKVGDVAKEMYNVVSPVFKAYQKVVRKALAVVVGAAVDTAIKKIKLFLKTASTIISSVLKVFNGLIKFLTGVFTGNWKKCWQGLKDIVSGIFSGLKAIVTAPINGIITTFNGVIGGVNKLADKLPQKLKKGLSFLPIPEIPQLYKGTSNWQGGLTSVNERGGEIIDLPRGSRVYPHDESVNKAYKDGVKKGRTQFASNNISIAKLADQIIVREEADIDKIAQKLADKLEKVSQNLSAEEIGYVY